MRQGESPRSLRTRSKQRGHGFGWSLLEDSRCSQDKSTDFFSISSRLPMSEKFVAGSAGHQNTRDIHVIIEWIQSHSGREVGLVEYN